MSECKCKQLEAQGDYNLLDKIIDEEYGGDKENLIMILQAIQKEYNYLPKDALVYLAEKLSLPISHIYEVVTFYASFSLKPRGKHIIQICTGTACHLKGSDKVVKELCSRLKVEPGETTEDGLFTIETVNCVGACALAMVSVVDGKYHPSTNQSEMNKIIEELSQGE